jgi:arginine utilization protein RocB
MGETAVIETMPWFAEVRAFTEALVRVRSVSPDPCETDVARTVLDLLRRADLGAAYAICDLAPIPRDPFGRQNAVAFLPGQRRETVVLLGHIDTVGTEDYGALEPIATNPAALAPHVRDLLGADHVDRPEEWMFGRGALDMKSGVAVNIAIMRHFAQRALAGDPPPFGLMLVATPDEETQSAGALAATGWLAAQRKQRNLRYIGLINTDYVAPRFPGDPARAIYSGSIGKLLPLLYVAGKATHVGDPYDGVDANLISAELVRDLCMNPALVDRVRGEQTPPPVTLHQADLKTSYNVQTAYAAWFYLNVLTMSATPERLLGRLQRRAQRSLDHVLARLAKDFRALHGADVALPAHLAGGKVYTFADLLRLTTQHQDIREVSRAMMAARAACPASMDSREATLHLVETAWNLAGRPAPAVVIAFAPPFYPHIAQREGPLLDAVRAVVARHAAEGVVLREFFPLLSDLSYMQSNGKTHTGALETNMPLWTDAPPDPALADYHIPFATIQDAQIEGVVNIGVFGQCGHQRGERVHMPYSFATVPQMVYETIMELATKGIA